MINNIIKIELNVEDYIDLLDQRRNFVEEHYKLAYSGLLMGLFLRIDSRMWHFK